MKQNSGYESKKELIEFSIGELYFIMNRLKAPNITEIGIAIAMKIANQLSSPQPVVTCAAIHSKLLLFEQGVQY